MSPAHWITEINDENNNTKRARKSTFSKNQKVKNYSHQHKDNLVSSN